MGYMGKCPVNPANVPPSVVNAARRDQTYFREISSPEVRRIYDAMDEVLDPLEYEGSLLFDEYPDAGTISRLAEQVLRRAMKQGKASDLELCAETDGGVGSVYADAGSRTAAVGNRSVDAGSGNAAAGSRSIDAGSEIADANAQDADTGEGVSGNGVRELTRALLCEEMCRRRFRHLLCRARIPAQI